MFVVIGGEPWVTVGGPSADYLRTRSRSKAAVWSVFVDRTYSRPVARAHFSTFCRRQPRPMASSATGSGKVSVRLSRLCSSPVRCTCEATSRSVADRARSGITTSVPFRPRCAGPSPQRTLRAPDGRIKRREMREIILATDYPLVLRVRGTDLFHLARVTAARTSAASSKGSRNLHKPYPVIATKVTSTGCARNGASTTLRR
jgi:hypothetical protein